MVQFEGFDIHNWINKHKEYGLDSWSIGVLIMNTNNREFIINAIMNPENYGLNNYAIISLVTFLKDKDIIIQFINNRKEYQLNSREMPVEMYRLITVTNDKEFIKECIVNYQKYDLEGEDVYHLISYINEPSFTINCIENRETLGFNESEQHVIQMIYDCKIGDNKQLSELTTKINLPENMTFGIEIESLGYNKDLLQNMTKKSFPNWKCRSEASLKSDKKDEFDSEIVSPILTGDNKETTEKIKLGCF